MSRTRTTTHAGGLVVLAMAMALFAGLFASTQAYADTTAWNSNVTVLAVGANDDDPVTEEGQRIDVTMTFNNLDDDLEVTAEEAEAYLQENITIAGRTISTTGAYASSYVRDVYDVTVSDNVITFKIDANTASTTTANYNGKLYIAAVSGTAIGNAMVDDVETLIGTGVAISNPDGVLNDDNSKTFTVTSAAVNRGMVHVLILDGGSAIFSGTGTFSNGGITVHAHTFTSQTVADFADLICSTANSTDVPSGTTAYTFTAGSDGSFTVSHGDASCENLQVFIYDGSYLNARSLAVGEITEAEMTNS